ncbi:CAP-associated domain-containing protein [Sporosarcina sp. G11-34]|uniref:CAP domain-containing protein n=1 Tax=Sporosarcina sp. G11-34 TaxID=2849605 RepID=UPI0022A9ACD9|nr:CAP-associated domain-containing protein [Sporosarcina sp. G11-34]MCZ2259322.1 CAP domain-containing protein [Sporosarcina sp. G11-34]
MKRLFLLISLVIALYVAKPLWEESISKYVDVSFFEPVDEKVEAFLNSESLSTTVQYIGDTLDKAVLFLSSKLTEKNEVASEVDKPSLTKPTHTQFSIYNIEIGTSKEEVTAKLGEPNGRSVNEYGTEWLTYHEEYHNYVMVSFDDKQTVNGIYTNDDLIASSVGVQYGSDKSLVRETFGKPIKELRKGTNIYILQESEGFDLFQVGETYAYIFYDLHKNDTVTAIKLVSKKLEQQKTGMYAGGDSILQFGFEQQLFDLTNAARVRHGLNALAWDDRAAGTARKHSRDMALNNYFSHENQQGLSPFERMKNDGIVFRSAGENLAYGQSSSIFAHEGLMNSLGHRENILLDRYSHLGVGAAFNDKSQPYYTETFLLK